MDLTLLVIPVLSYLLGSIPFSYIITRWKTGGDIRQLGSGNVGATNVMRTTGRLPGIAALTLDTAKGMIAVLVVGAWIGLETWSAVAGFFAAAGHSFPLFLRFRGGKSVATGGGAFLLLSPYAMLSSIGLFALLLITGRIVSLASMVASASFPFLAWIFGSSRGIIIWGAATAILILIRHGANIIRLFQGTERRMPSKKE